MTKDLIISGKTIRVYFDEPLETLQQYAPPSQSVVITDEHVHRLYQHQLSIYRTIVLPAGEKHKQQATVDRAILQLIDLGADRNTLIVGVGGGVVTDLAGYIASIYMRGIPFGFVPTTILAMVDASVGGKNGVDVGMFKNLVGTINQPQFLLYDFKVLETLPEEEWRSGFAEIIKHACICDRAMFDELALRNLSFYRKDLHATGALVQQNVEIKYGIVAGDETESGARRLLNFGHTIGHAIENVTGLLHGYAISVGMVTACKISQATNGFSEHQTKEIVQMLQRYGLPVSCDVDRDEAWQNLIHDKKKSGANMNFIVLDEIGQGKVKAIPLSELKTLYQQL